MGCACKTGNRSIAIVAVKLFEEFPEIAQYAATAGWEQAPDLDAVVAPLGPDSPIKSRCELEDLCRGLIEPARLGRLRCAALQPGLPLVDQVRNLLHAEPLISECRVPATPLLTILEQRRIETFVQPVVTPAGDVWGFECLMRATDDAGTRISPAQLIEWARRENLIFMLDRVCRERHIERASRLLAGRELKALINFLPTAIYEPEFCLRSTMAAARRFGLEPRKVIFEVIESEKLTDFNHLARIIDEYRRMGFGAALDDMGSGYAGLELVAALKPDLIKIDRELVRNAPRSPWHATICRMLVQLAHEHGKLALAEGVETAEESAAAIDCGADLLQGYYFARPVPADDLERIEDALLQPAVA